MICSTCLRLCLVVLLDCGKVGASISNAEMETLVGSGFLGCTNLGGALVAVGEAKPLNDSKDAQLTAGSRAKLFATKTLLQFSVKDLSWPKSLKPEVVSALEESFLRLHPLEAKLAGVQNGPTVRTGNGRVRAAVYLESPEKQITKYKMAEVRQTLKDGLTENPEMLDIAAYLEVCDESEIPQAVTGFGKHCSRYGQGAAITITGNDADTALEFGNLLEQGSDAAGSKKISEALTLLGSNAYNPSLCLSLGGLYEARGRFKAAQLFYSRGASVFFGLPAAARCSAKLSGKIIWPDGRPKQSLDDSIPQDIVLRKAQAELAAENELPEVCRLIVESAGRLPLKDHPEGDHNYKTAWRFFTQSQPDLNAALKAAAKSLQETPSADAANLAGRIFMLQGRKWLALPFFEQSLSWNPKHPYAGKNLAELLDGLKGSGMPKQNG